MLFKYGDYIHFHTTTSLICLLTKITIVQLDGKDPNKKIFCCQVSGIYRPFLTIVLIVLGTLSCRFSCYAVGEYFMTDSVKQ